MVAEVSMMADFVVKVSETMRPYSNNSYLSDLVNEQFLPCPSCL
jgi:hypothetical protein